MRVVQLWVIVFQRGDNRVVAGVVHVMFGLDGRGCYGCCVCTR